MSVNTGCQTADSTEIALGTMGSVNDTYVETVGSEEMEAARQDLMQEMTARAESIGPANHHRRSRDQTPADTEEQPQEGDSAVTGDAMDRGGQSVEPPAGKCVQPGGDGPDGVDSEVDVAAMTSQGVKDEHCIDDMYA